MYRHLRMYARLFRQRKKYFVYSLWQRPVVTPGRSDKRVNVIPTMSS